MAIVENFIYNGKNSKIQYKDYLYLIRNKTTGNVYLGQTAQQKNSQRVYEHFKPNSRSEATKDVIQNAQNNEIEIRIYPGPQFGIGPSRYNTFLSFFDLSGRRVAKNNTNTRANELYNDAYQNGYKITTGNPKHENLTIGNMLDIAEILHIANWYFKIGSQLKNRQMGGQQSSWTYAGTTTRAFHRQMTPAEAYLTIIGAKQLDLNTIQQKLNQHLINFLTKGLTVEQASKILKKTGQDVLSLLNDPSLLVSLMLKEYLKQNINTWIEKVQKQILKDAAQTKQSVPLSNINFSLKCKSTDAVKDQIIGLLTKVLKVNIQQNKIKTIEDLENILTKKWVFNSTKEQITLPITLFVEIEINKEDNTNVKKISFADWWKIQDNSIPVQEDDLKWLAYNEFKEIYYEVTQGIFYQEKTDKNSWRSIGFLDKQDNIAFKKYQYRNENDYLRIRMKQAYRMRKITKYDNQWDAFFYQMINLMPSNLIQIGSRPGWGIYTRYEPVITRDDKEHYVATFIKDGELRPGEKFSLEKIKIY